MAQPLRSVSRKRRHTRVRKRVSGTAAMPRLNVFRSLGNIYAQVIDDTTGKTLAQASTLDPALRDAVAGKPKTDQAKTVGGAVAERAKAVGIAKVVFDRGGYKYHGRVKALADAARAAGLEF